MHIHESTIQNGAINFVQGIDKAFNATFIECDITITIDRGKPELVFMLCSFEGCNFLGSTPFFEMINSLMMHCIINQNKGAPRGS